MLRVEIILHCLIYSISLSNPLQCTTDCYFMLDFSSPFDVPPYCNQTASAKQCKVDVSISYGYNSLFLSLSADTFDYSLGDYQYVMAQVSADGLATISYSVTRYCKKRDDCARELARQSMLEIIQRPLIDPQSIGKELYPLLSSNSSNSNVDLLCFDQNENVRQCGIASQPGACEISHQLVGKKSIVRSCNNKLFTQSQSVIVMDSGKLARFSIDCNRSLCNGAVTLQAVKEIFFKYNLTKTIEGRLNNDGFRLSLSSFWIILIVLSWFEK